MDDYPPPPYAFCATCNEHWAEIGFDNGTGWTAHISFDCPCCDESGAYTNRKPRPYDAGVVALTGGTHG